MYKYKAEGKDSPPIPKIKINIQSPKNPKMCKSISAVIDTGADQTCVPTHVIDQIGNLDYSYIKVRGAIGKTEKMKKCIIDLSLSTCEYKDHEVIEINREYAIIGRDILNDYTLVLDGPNNKWSVNL